MEYQHLIHAHRDHPIEDVTLSYIYLLLMYSISPHSNNIANALHTWNPTPFDRQQIFTILYNYPPRSRTAQQNNSELYHRFNISNPIHSNILIDQLFTQSNAPFATPTLPYSLSPASRASI